MMNEPQRMSAGRLLYNGHLGNRKNVAIVERWQL